MTGHHINALAAGTRLGAYSIERVLGAGAFGITYKCRESGTGRLVAIKEYLPAALAMRCLGAATVEPLSESVRAEFEWGRRRFQQEARLLTTLDHPNIVPVLAYFELQGTAYIAMEYQDGRNLGELLGDEPLGEADLLSILMPLLDAVEALHRQGFLHRDIKPENIFIRTDGRPILLDFGSARQPSNGEAEGLTAVLTPGYAPYEQYQYRGEQGPWTDIYALGALMFRCLLGRRPPDAAARTAARVRGMADPLVAGLEILRSQASRATASALTAAMTLNEDQRPRSIAAFRAILLGARPWTAAADQGSRARGLSLRHAGFGALLLAAAAYGPHQLAANNVGSDASLNVGADERAAAPFCVAVSEARRPR